MTQGKTAGARDASPGAGGTGGSAGALPQRDPEAGSAPNLPQHFAELEAIYETAPVGLAVLGTDLRFLRINRRFAELNGVAVADHIGKTVREVAPDLADAAEALARRVIETGEPILDVEITGETPARPGVPMICVESWLPLKSADGRVVSINIVAEDVTDRKRAEADLRAAHRELSDILDSISDAFYALDAELRIVYVNRRAATMWDKSEEELLGRPFLDVYPQVLGTETWAAHLRANETRQPVQIESFSLVSNRWVARNIYPRPAGGLSVFFRDISEQRESELKLRRLAETLEGRVAERTAELQAANSALTQQIAERERAEAVLRESEERHRQLYNRTPMALHSVDAAARLIDVNDHWLQLFGYARGEVLGRSPTEFMTEDSARLYREIAWPEMLDGASLPRTFEYCFVKRSGETFIGRLSSRGERDAGGRFLRTWSVVADVTAQRRAEEQLRQAQKMEAVGQLTSGVAHDFNNVLAAVIGNLELLQSEVASERGKRLLASATRAGERGAKLTEQLLAFSRKQHLASTSFDVNALISGMDEMLSRAIGPSVRIVKTLTPDLWPALADTSQVEIAILNLVINSRDAMPQGGTITIATANCRAGDPELAAEIAGELVRISVADHGTGMSEAVVSRAFEPFFTTKEVGKGTGLGLSTVYGVAKQSGGTAVIRSQLGEGTTVSIYLPRSTVTEDAEKAAIRHLDAGEARPHAGRIMVIDDDEDVREYVTEFLKRCGYDVVPVEAGPAGLEAIEAGDAIDAIVVDYAMPMMTGAEVARRARASRPDLPVVLITGY
ncbi:MAG: PAS domain-containing protein, partial [Alphaproteobacteria bacterium]|nr:PAS domain-containing protein [Alphaproteobacteria bacterium]